MEGFSTHNYPEDQHCTSSLKLFSRTKRTASLLCYKEDGFGDIFRGASYLDGELDHMNTWSEISVTLGLIANKTVEAVAAQQRALDSLAELS